MKEYAFENGSLEVDVCFRKSELKIRNLLSFDVGACSARVA